MLLSNHILLKSFPSCQQQMRSANAHVISRLCPGKLLFIIDGAALPLEDVTRPRADVQEQQPWALPVLRPPWHKVRVLLGVSLALVLAVRELGAPGRPPPTPAGKRGTRLPLRSPVAGTGRSTHRRAPALAQAGAARGPGTREGRSGARLVWAGGCYEHRGLCRAPAPRDPLRPQRGVWGKEM